MRSNQIDPRILEVLSAVSIDAKGAVQIVERLDRKEYTKTNEVLESLGGKWNKKAKAHLFEGVDDVRERIEGVINLGAFINPKKAYDLFETPEQFAFDLANRMYRVERGGPRMTAFLRGTVLEPSAGNGNLVQALFDNYPKIGVHALEIQKSCFDQLHVRFDREWKNERLAIWNADFTTATFERKYAGCLMNPPFSKQQDIDHVQRAIGRMTKEPGCTLVAVMSAGVKFRENSKSKAFRAQLAELDAAIEDNPEGTFSPAGTNVNTVTVVVRW